MILASNNAHKLDEFRAIFADMGIEIIPQSAAGCDFEVDETGETFEENAYLKAIAVTRATAMTRWSCRMATTGPWRSCARKRKTPFPTAEMRSKS